jgi:hypothetical protein
MDTYRIISYLNIPTFCCLIITQQDYVRKNLVSLNQTYFPHDTPIPVIEYYVDSSYDDLYQCDNNFNLIKKSFTALNRNIRKHKVAFFSLLDKYQLLDSGQISFNLASTQTDLSHDGKMRIKDPDIFDAEKLPPNLEILLPTPFTRCNENWHLTNPYLHEIFDTFTKNTSDNFFFKNFNEDIEMINTVEEFHKKIDFIQESFLYVAIETIFYYPGSFVSTKSFNGISRKRPFVIVGPAGNLKKLKEWGFKTFDHWWDEGYDDIIDPAGRMLAVFDIVKTVSEKSNSELIDLANAMADVLEYNYNHLINDFPALQLDDLDKQCLANLKQ